MTRFQPLFVVTAWLGAHSVLTQAAQVPPPSAAVQDFKARPPMVRYLANEGVLIEGRGGRVFIDAFFGDGLPDYAVVPAALRDSLERGLGGFDGPAVVLTTHGHRDHFDAPALARYLASNAEAVAVGPPETGARLDSVVAAGRERIRAVSPSADRPAAVDLGWVRLLALAIPHGPTSRPVQHAAYLLTLDGTTLLHLGDTGSDPDTWPALGLPSGGVDVALVPYWYALDETRFAALLAVTRARTVVLLHTPRADGDNRWAAIARDLRKRYRQVEIPASPGAAVGLRAQGGR